MKRGRVGSNRLNFWSGRQRARVMTSGPLVTQDSSDTVSAPTVRSLIDISAPLAYPIKLSGSVIERLGEQRLKNFRDYWMEMDRKGIKILKGFDHDDNDRSWAEVDT